MSGILILYLYFRVIMNEALKMKYIYGKPSKTMLWYGDCIDLEGFILNKNTFFLKIYYKFYLHFFLRNDFYFI